MNRFQLLTSYSPWFILLCLAVGALYAFALYQRKPSWSKAVNWALAGCRFALVSLLCFLLLGPLVRQVRNTYEKPTVVIALDNSQSMALTNDSVRLAQTVDQVRNLAGQLQGRNINVDVQLLEGSVPAANLQKDLFKSQVTNLDNLLGTIQSNYENRNLAGVVLVSDGIYNQGMSPEFQPYNFPIYSVGLGDTVPRRDLNLKALYYNKISYLGNKFPIVAEVHGTGFGGKIATAQLMQGSKVLDTKTISFKNDNDVAEATFYVAAGTKGVQHYAVQLVSQPEEFTAQNNSRDAYIEVIDGKEKILLLAAAPHPDIKAIKSALEKNENYEFESVIAGLGAPKQAKYDLVILHQIPDVYNTGSTAARKFLEGDTPIWYILGSGSNLGQLNVASNVVKVTSRGGQTDQVFPVFNANFNLFRFDDANRALLQKMPPVTVPFGDFRLTPNSEVILYQKVGTLTTDKPLLVVNNDKVRKSAILLGEGLWEWRLEEYNLTDNHLAVDELITKLVQYLSSKEDKRRLRVYPVTDEFLDTERIVFEAETYNDIYEKIYDQKIALEVTHPGGKVSRYNFTNTETNSRFETGGLPKGVYQYRATARVQNRNEVVTGQFTVREIQLEAITTTADHGLLRKLGNQTGGGFYLPAQFDQLASRLTNNPPPDRVQSTEDTRELIHLKWLFFVLLLLASAEWGVRKFQGAY
jgi:hypothetical protein